MLRQEGAAFAQFGRFGRQAERGGVDARWSGLRRRVTERDSPRHPSDQNKGHRPFACTTAHEVTGVKRAECAACDGAWFTKTLCSAVELWFKNSPLLTLASPPRPTSARYTYPVSQAVVKANSKIGADVSRGLA
jgi:hypothetical protein